MNETKDITVQELQSSDSEEVEVEDIPTFLDKDSDAGVFSPNHDGLLLCPDCKEDMLLTISLYLVFLIMRYCKLRCKKGSEYTILVLQMGMDICNLLTREKKHDLTLKLAAIKEWPVTNINFQLILRQVHMLSTELNQLMFSKTYLEHSFIWDAFK